MVSNDHKKLARFVIEYLFYEVGHKAEHDGGERERHVFLGARNCSDWRTVHLTKAGLTLKNSQHWRGV